MPVRYLHAHQMSEDSSSVSNGIRIDSISVLQQEMYACSGLMLDLS